MEKVVDRIFFSALIAISSFIASSISSLNEKVAVVISKVSEHDRRLDGHDSQIDKLKGIAR